MGRMKDFFVYTAARLAVFLVTFGLLWGVASLFLETSQVFTIWILLMALIISSVISIFALVGLREKLAGRIQHRAEALQERLEESRSAEDVD